MKPEKYGTVTKRNITNEGTRHLGAAVGTEEFRKEYVIMRVNE